MKIAILCGVAIILQLYKLTKLQQLVRHYKKLLAKINILQVLSIKQLKNKIAAGIYKAGDYFLCQGRLSPGQTIKSILDKNVKIAYSQLLVDKVFQIGDSRNTVRKHLRKILIGLLNLADADQKIKIFQTFKTKFITSKFIKKTKSYRQKIFNFGWLISLFLKTPTRIISNVYIQSYIPQNAKVTTLAQIYSQSVNHKNQFSIKAPIAIASSKAQLQLYFSNKLESTTYLAYGFYIMILATFYVIYRFYLKPAFPGNNQAKRNANKEQISKIQKIYVSDRNCFHCHQTLSSIIYQPCNHLQSCQECYKKQVHPSINSSCEQCKKQVKQIVVVYPC